MNNITKQLADALRSLLAYEDDKPGVGTYGREVYQKANEALAAYDAKKPLIPMVSESEITAVMTLVKQYNPSAVDWTDEHMRGIIFSLIKHVHDCEGRPSQCESAGFVVTLGYVRDGRAYYHVSMDAELLCSDSLREKYTVAKLPKTD